MELTKENIRHALQPLRHCKFISDHEKSAIFGIANQFNEFVSNHGFEQVKNAVSVFAGEYKQKDITNKSSYFRSAIQKILENPMMDIFEKQESETAPEMQFEKSIIQFQDCGFSTECYLLVSSDTTEEEIEKARTKQNNRMIERIKQTSILDDKKIHSIIQMWNALDDENERKTRNGNPTS